MDTFKNMGKLTNNRERSTLNNSDTEDEDD